MRAFRPLFYAVVCCALATSAAAEFSTVNDESNFLKLVEGKELKRPFVNIEVSPGGDISGYGAAWPVTGNWTWNDGYFCRELFWGGDPLGYNCQQVMASGDRIRFTSDKGSGDSADFRLR
ncbi:MAG: dihydrodipicolinate reductase [Roseobacter sp.]